MESQLKFAGNFQELKSGDRKGPSLKSAIADTPQEHEGKIIKYLKSGVSVAAAACIAVDELATGQKSIGPLVAFTDGVWHWHSDLVYYVEHYHARIPPEFVGHMKANNWTIPPVDLKTLSKRSSPN